MNGRRSLSLLLSLACSGCSYAFVNPAPPNHEQLDWVDCTSNRIAPIADVGAALEFAAMAIFIELMSSVSFSGHGNPDGVSSEGRVAQVAALGLGGVAVASAAYGFRKTAECDRATQLWQLRFAEPRPRPDCRDDSDCKTGRRCVRGACEWTPATPQPEGAPQALLQWALW